MFVHLLRALQLAAMLLFGVPLPVKACLLKYRKCISDDDCCSGYCNQIYEPPLCANPKNRIFDDDTFNNVYDAQPSQRPSTSPPSSTPSISPTRTILPSEMPSSSSFPSTTPTAAVIPSETPSSDPTSNPTTQPSARPSLLPSLSPSDRISQLPSRSLSASPSTASPSETPSSRILKSPPGPPISPQRPSPFPSSTDSSSPTATTLPCSNSQLGPNTRLYQNEFICSPDKRYNFGVSPDGDLSLWEASVKVWSAVTCCTGENVFLVMQGDGNAVVRSSLGVLWSSRTNGNEGAFVNLDNDGIPKIIKDETVLWETDYCDYLVRTLPPPGPSPPNLVPVDASTLSRKIMAGYQGWFGTRCDGGYNRWKHWTGGVRPDEDSFSCELWPDMREFDDDEICPTGFQYSDGSNAGLFSSFTTKTVERHLRWMYDYGIDGIFVQRFVNELKNDRCTRDHITDDIRRGAEQYGRVFANMYDISGADASLVYMDIKLDWMHLVDVGRITESDRYLRHNNRPVLAIWGFGFGSRVGEPDEVAELIDWFQNTAEEKYRVTLMGGVPTGWRTLTRDSKTGADWANVYRSFDIISPWAVGRYAGDAGADNFRKNFVEPDLEECHSLGIDYLPVVFPGFSFSNRKPKAFNEIPRNGGKFFWKQMFNAMEAGSNQIYVGMFDEVDEGTAIFKVAETAEQTPTTGRFLTLDADGYNVPSDWYLRLTGNATQMLREVGRVPNTMPALPPEFQIFEGSMVHDEEEQPDASAALASDSDIFEDPHAKKSNEHGRQRNQPPPW